MSEIHVLARLTLKPGMKERMIPVIKEMVQATKAEPGTLQYNASFKDDVTVVFYEIYQDEEALKAHSKGLKKVRIATGKKKKKKKKMKKD